MSLHKLLVAVILLALAALAQAQEKTPAPPPEGGAKPAGGEPAPPPEEAPLPDDFKVDDDPNNPDAMTTRPDPDDIEVKAKVEARPTKETYPLEAIKRPLTLTQGQAEVSLDLPFTSYPTVDDMGMETDGRAFMQVLRAGYGVTQDFQIGLTYNFGLEQVSPKSHYEAGKAFSLDAGYTIVPGWLAVQVSLPFYVDPFAMSLTLGIPFRLTLTEKIAIVGGSDLLQIKFVKFPVDPANAAYNVLTLAAIDQAGQAEPDGNFNLTLGALWQAQPNIAAALMTGVLYPDFKSEDTPVPMWIDVRWSKNPQFDVGGRVGTGALDDFGGRVFFSIYTAYRI